jgi:hypothetical protein
MILERTGHVGKHRLELFREINPGRVHDRAGFPDAPPAGHSASYVICNGVPGSDTRLLVELVKALGGHANLGCHTGDASIRSVSVNSAYDDDRSFPTPPLWVSALRGGYVCGSHTAYCPHLEQYLLQRKQHKMLFLVRDPRDLAVMRTPKPEAGSAAHLDDASQIASSIVSLPGSGIHNYMSWLDSPACLTVQLERLYAELSEINRSTTSSPVLDDICDYLALPRPTASELASAIGRDLLSSQITQIGAYRSRMTPRHVDLLRGEPFQKLVVEFGYEPTPPGKNRFRSVRRALVQMVRRGLTLVQDVPQARPAH